MNFFFWRKSDAPPTEEAVPPLEAAEAEITQEVKIALDGLEEPKKKLVELQKRLSGKISKPPSVPPSATPEPSVS